MTDGPDGWSRRIEMGAAASYAREVVAGAPVMAAVARRVDSTNRTVRELVVALDREQSVVGPFALLAWEQEAGRGRLGRQWLSRAGDGLYLSLFWPLAAAEGAEFLPLRVGVAVPRAVERVAPDVAVRIKWPNDLLVGGRKLGGILIERLRLSEAGEAAVIGIGINHGHDRESVFPGATSLLLESEPAGPAPMADLALAVLSAVVGELEGEFDRAEVVAACVERLAHRDGDAVSWQSPEGPRRGVYRGLAGDGSLLLETDQGVVPVHAGEIMVAPDDEPTAS